MNYKFLVLIFLFLYSCTAVEINNNKIKTSEYVQSFSTKGFALLFDENLKKNKIVNKKIESRSLIIFQKNLKKHQIN